ncbi:conserved protein of unknown function [Thauera humireducens]|uniref:hypothetical protein n=1 Tax=Thauera humireducens TaxID=1134435 RepID=UPI002467A62C|nr:hypothetical protein [Thauera humireducens]CAH1747692.1 conserved protein of unknown function [Thauera humireducens]
MTPDLILQHLQSQYPGQLVLYAGDLAKVLGKTEKALAHLIARGQLPFALKTLGGRKCVDIFQLAEWLARDGEERSDPAGVASRARKGGAPKAQAASDGAIKPRGSKSSIGGRLLEMRHRAAMTVSRIGSTSEDPAEAVFFGELAAGLLAQPGAPATNWTITCVRWLRLDGVYLRQESKGFAEREGEVRSLIVSMRAEARDALQATVVVRRGRHLDYRAFYLDCVGWTVLIDKAGFSGAG